MRREHDEASTWYSHLPFPGLSLILSSRLIDADAQAQWNAVPENYRLQGSLKACDRRPVERDFMVNMKLNYLHIHFLLRRALLRPMSTAPAPELFRVSKDMLGLVIETTMLKDQIINSGTSLVWKVLQRSLQSRWICSLTLLLNLRSSTTDCQRLGSYRSPLPTNHTPIRRSRWTCPGYSKISVSWWARWSVGHWYILTRPIMPCSLKQLKRLNVCLIG